VFDPKALAVCVVVAFVAAGCFGPADDQARGMDAGPARAFKKWVATVEANDYRSMWEQLPITAKERFRYAWDDEKEQLEKSPLEARTRFMEVYGFASWTDVKGEEADAFFIRSMGRYPAGKLPTKYELLKRARIHKIVYGDEGTSCMVTFLDADGSPLPLRMKMLREGDDWKVVRLP